MKPNTLKIASIIVALLGIGNSILSICLYPDRVYGPLSLIFLFAGVVVINIISWKNKPPTPLDDCEPHEID